MLRWLDKHPDAGLLNWHTAWINGPAVVQYWRSFEQLERFARAADQPHLSTWKWFNRAVNASGDVGIWHETYKVRAGDYECIYINMPRVGLEAAGVHTPIGTAGQSAARRIGATGVDEPALIPYAAPGDDTFAHHTRRDMPPGRCTASPQGVASPTTSQPADGSGDDAW